MGTFFSQVIPLNEFFTAVGAVFPYTWFLILPAALLVIFMFLWMDYVWELFILKTKYTLLEVVPPRDIERSPLPMELVFNSLASTDKGLTVAEQYIVGEILPVFSFEFMGEGGKVRMFIRVDTRYRNLLESAMYAQYPDVQLVEATDYVNEIPRGIPNKSWNLWGVNFALVRPDAYPLRTYPHFQEDVTGKMMDPLAYLLEILGKLPPGHRIWFQIVVTSTRPDWFVERKKFVNQLMAKMAKEKGVDSGDMAALEMKLTPVEKKVLEAIEANIGKQTFRCQVRFVYIGPTVGFDKASFVTGFIGSMKLFNDSNLNSFKPDSESKTFAAYVFAKPRLRYRQRLLLRRYKDRSLDPHNTTIYLSSAELATLFHMPDTTVLAPALMRVGAKRGSAPSNLPVD